MEPPVGHLRGEGFEVPRRRVAGRNDVDVRAVRQQGAGIAFEARDHVRAAGLHFVHVHREPDPLAVPGREFRRLQLVAGGVLGRRAHQLGEAAHEVVPIDRAPHIFDFYGHLVRHSRR
jgi:hypothetical protein